jgi:hypothetical protein
MDNQLYFYLNQDGQLVNVKDVRKKLNPLIRSFGEGPKGQRCKNCKHLYGKQYSKIYYKCELRGDTNGTKTDHKINWPACGKFELE